MRRHQASPLLLAVCGPPQNSMQRASWGELVRALAFQSRGLEQLTLRQQGDTDPLLGGDSACSSSTVRSGTARDRLQAAASRAETGALQRARPCKSCQGHGTTPAPRRHAGVLGEIRHFRRQARGVQGCLGCDRRLGLSIAGPPIVVQTRRHQQTFVQAFPRLEDQIWNTTSLDYIKETDSISTRRRELTKRQNKNDDVNDGRKGKGKKA